MSGIRAAGRLQVATTALKILPLLIVGVAGAIALVPAHFEIHAAGAQAAGKDLLYTVTLTLWAFLGLECATIPAASVRDAERTIPRATVIGTLMAAALFILSTVGVMGVVPPSILATSTAPFADAAAHLFGNTAAKFVSAGAAISCLGALNGWVLMAGQLPLAVARDGLFPRVFMTADRRGTPIAGLVIAGVLSTALVAMNYSRGLVKLFEFMILLSTLGTLIAYVFCSLAVLLRNGPRPEATRMGISLVAALGFIYAFGAVAGAGVEAVYWGFLLMLAGLPVYTWVVRRPGARPTA
jgi:APA family basic amino acid/polyamine antiporter